MSNNIDNLDRFMEDREDSIFCQCDKPKVMIIDNSKIEYSDGHIDDFYAEVCVNCMKERGFSPAKRYIR